MPRPRLDRFATTEFFNRDGVRRVEETTSTSATKRYPLLGTVSTKAGAPIESPSAWRIFRMAVWTPVSTSTNTSLPHKRSTMSARDTS